MEIITTGDGWLFLFRWLHFLAGVAWIGMLWYFNFVQTPFFGSELGGGVKGAMTRGLVPTRSGGSVGGRCSRSSRASRSFS